MQEKNIAEDSSQFDVVPTEDIGSFLWGMYQMPLADKKHFSYLSHKFGFVVSYKSMRSIKIHKILLKVLFMCAHTNKWMMDEIQQTFRDVNKRGEIDCKIKQAQKYCTLNE